MNDIIKTLRKKYLDIGFDDLTDREKLMILLSYTEKNGNVEACADKILGCYGSFYAAAGSDPMFITNECGTNQMSAIMLNLVSQLRRRCDINNASHFMLNGPTNAKNYFTAYHKGNRVEVSVAAAVNSKYGIKRTEILGRGGFSNVRVTPRSVLEFAKKNNCRYIFLSHCHPNGDPSPSRADIAATRDIRSSLNSSGFFLIDHIITGKDSAVSLREYMGDDLFDDAPDYNDERIDAENEA